SQEDKAVWGELFSDYEVFPAFPQLNREIYRIEPEKAEDTEIKLHEKDDYTYLGYKPGWIRRHQSEDQGYLTWHTRSFPTQKVSVTVEYGSCYFSAARKRLELGAVDPLVMSEVLRDLAAVRD
ncbi:MAG: DUF4132 domain-containing protein, partial [Cyanobacteria bacterium P01_A01_bin.40]